MVAVFIVPLRSPEKVGDVTVPAKVASPLCAILNFVLKTLLASFTVLISNDSKPVAPITLISHFFLSAVLPVPLSYNLIKGSSFSKLILP